VRPRRARWRSCVTHLLLLVASPVRRADPARLSASGWNPPRADGAAAGSPSGGPACDDGARVVAVPDRSDEPVG
jgi:hypothetical protein